MDFHSLTRKDLQTLCKKNKIPANLTNVAMADALKALETVEGLDEFMNQSQSPERSMNQPSQEIPTTVTKASTRRKTAKEEPKSTQPTTRTRRTTRKALDVDEENKNVNVPDTPVIATTTRRRAQKSELQVEELKKTDVLESPALHSGGRRTGVGSTRRKVQAQKEEHSVQQQGYGTRRSVRLLEKGMAVLSLKESGRIEPGKIDETVENGTEENQNGQSGATSEVPLARNLSASLDDERDFKDEAASHSCDNLESLSALDTKYESPNEKTDGPDLDKPADMSDGTIDVAASHSSYNLDSLSTLDTKDESPNEKTDEPAIDKPADMSDGTIDEVASHSSDNLDSLSALDSKEESPIEKTDESFAYLAESSDKPADMADGTVDPKGSVDVAVPEDSYEIDNSHAELVAAENIGDSHADGETKPIAFEDVSEEVLDLHASSAQLMELIEVGSGEENADQAPPQTECQKFVGKDCDDINVVMQDNQANDDLSKLPDDEGLVEDPQNVAVLPQGLVDSSENLGNEESKGDPDQIVTESDFDAFLVDSDFDDVSSSDNNSFADELEDQMTNMVNEEEALFDVNVAEDETTRVTETSFQISVDKIQDYDDVLVDVCVRPAEEFAETTQELILPLEKSTIPTAASPLVSKVAMTSSIPLSPLKAQFSLPRKSSSKKQTTLSKVAQVSVINKENIDNNSVKEMGASMANMKNTKKKIIDEETMKNLDTMSLIQLKKLTKMFESKLQITDNTKNNEDKNDSKQQPCGKTRAALQRLPQNCMHAGEAEKEN